MENIKIGLVGGCLAGLGNVGKSQLFYSRLKSGVKPDFDVTFSLEGYSNIEDLEEKIKNLNSKRKLDILLLQVRPAPFVRACRLFLRAPQYRVNPLLLGRKPGNLLKMPAEAEDEFVGTIKDLKYSVKRKYFSAFNINVFLGFMFGVNKRVENYYIEQIISVSQLCKDLGIRLIVHGPVPRNSLGMANKLLRSFANKLERQLKPICPYASTLVFEYEGGGTLFEDGAHVNLRGHKMLAERLFPLVSSELAQFISSDNI